MPISLAADPFASPTVHKDAYFRMKEGIGHLLADKAGRNRENYTSPSFDNSELQGKEIETKEEEERWRSKQRRFLIMLGSMWRASVCLSTECYHSGSIPLTNKSTAEDVWNVW